jgi:Putative nuclear envelope organisation protein
MSHNGLSMIPKIMLDCLCLPPFESDVFHPQVYSTWSDNQLQTYLKNQGFLDDKNETTREQLFTLMKEAYISVADPIWNAWSDSYMVRTGFDYIHFP